MAVLNLTIPDAVVNRIFDAIAANHGYNAGGGQTKAQFAKQIVIQFLKNEVQSLESRQAADAARTASDTAVATDIVIT